MSPPDTSLDFFEAMYRRDADPWDFASSEYEQGRYQAILNALDGRIYARAFEPGCSIGVLTAGLAGHCDRVDAMDLSPSAIKQAKSRCRGLKNVHLISGSLAEAMPEGEFDLIVLSEIGYYFHEARLQEIAERLVRRLQHGGHLLAAHWLGESPDHVLSGDQVHEVLGRIAGLSRVRSERHAGFRLEVWERV
jgi:SAM-dependent methyltransferase